MGAITLVVAVLLVMVTPVTGCTKGEPAVEHRGHEETRVPTATPGPFPSTQPKPEKPKQVTRVEQPKAPLPGCRSLDEWIASITKAAPDAKASHIPADHVAEYVKAFNMMHGTTHRADEVAVVTSELWGDLALVLFEWKGCEAGTEQITFSGHDDE